MSCSSVNSVGKWDMLMNFCGQNGSALCHVPKGISLLLNFLNVKPITNCNKTKKLSLSTNLGIIIQNNNIRKHYLELLWYLVTRLCSLKVMYS